jgi:NAD(P)-dependent dehydrogenase (short-subunit alcohol dehydrogenase family)
MKLNATYHDLKGKHVFITGGGSGIGASLTEGFIASGCKVSFVGLSDANDFCDEIASRYDGNRPHFMTCNIQDIDKLHEAMDEAAEKFGPINILLNNAARDDRHELQDYSVEDWDQSIATNLRPHYFTAKKAAPGMIEAGEGVILNMSSISYMMGNAGYPAYVAAKAGINGLTRGLARELGPHNIRVNAVMPGWILTERQRELWVTEEGLAGHLERQCLKRELEPLDMVEPILFLASNASAAITSQGIVVDGGVVFG